MAGVFLVLAITERFDDVKFNGAIAVVVLMMILYRLEKLNERNK